MKKSNLSKCRNNLSKRRNNLSKRKGNLSKRKGNLSKRRNNLSKRKGNLSNRKGNLSKRKYTGGAQDEEVPWWKRELYIPPILEGADHDDSILSQWEQMLYDVPKVWYSDDPQPFNKADVCDDLNYKDGFPIDLSESKCWQNSHCFLGKKKNPRPEEYKEECMSKYKIKGPKFVERDRWSRMIKDNSQGSVEAHSQKEGGLPSWFIKAYYNKWRDINDIKVAYYILELASMQPDEVIRCRRSMHEDFCVGLPDWLLLRLLVDGAPKYEEMIVEDCGPLCLKQLDKDPSRPVTRQRRLGRLRVKLNQIFNKDWHELEQFQKNALMKLNIEHKIKGYVSPEEEAATAATAAAEEAAETATAATAAEEAAETATAATAAEEAAETAAAVAAAAADARRYWWADAPALQQKVRHAAAAANAAVLQQERHAAAAEKAAAEAAAEAEKAAAEREAERVARFQALRYRAAAKEEEDARAELKFSDFRALMKYRDPTEFTATQGADTVSAFIAERSEKLDLIKYLYPYMVGVGSLTEAEKEYIKLVSSEYIREFIIDQVLDPEYGQGEFKWEMSKKQKLIELLSEELKNAKLKYNLTDFQRDKLNYEYSIGFYIKKWLFFKYLENYNLGIYSHTGVPLEMHEPISCEDWFNTGPDEYVYPPHPMKNQNIIDKVLNPVYGQGEYRWKESKKQKLVENVKEAFQKEGISHDFTLDDIEKWLYRKFFNDNILYILNYKLLCRWATPLDPQKLIPARIDLLSRPMINFEEWKVNKPIHSMPHQLTIDSLIINNHILLWGAKPKGKYLEKMGTSSNAIIEILKHYEIQNVLSFFNELLKINSINFKLTYKYLESFMYRMFLYRFDNFETVYDEGVATRSRKGHLEFYDWKKRNSSEINKWLDEKKFEEYYTRSVE